MATIGISTGLLAARCIRSFLFGTTTHDIPTYVAAGMAVLLAGVVAILLPALWAIGIDLIAAL